jgi:hypothetical protein
MKTNGYVIFNYSSLDVYEPLRSEFLPLVFTHFNAVLTFCGWFHLTGMTPHCGNLASPTVLLLYRPLLEQSRHEIGYCDVL